MSDLVPVLKKEAILMARPLREAFRDRKSLYTFLWKMNWNLHSVVKGAQVDDLLSGVQDALDLLDNIPDPANDASFEDYLTALGQFGSFVQGLEQAIEAVKAAPDPPLPDNIASLLAEDILNYLAVAYLTSKRIGSLPPGIFAIGARALGIVRDEAPAEVRSGGALLRVPSSRPTLRLDAIGDIFGSEHWRALYLPNGLTGPPEARAFTESFLKLLGNLVIIMGGDAMAGTRIIGADNDLWTRSASYLLPIEFDDGIGGADVSAEVGASVTMVPSSMTSATGAQGPGIDLRARGEVGLEQTVGDWNLGLRFRVESGAQDDALFFIGKSDFRTDGSNFRVDADLVAERPAGPQPLLRIGSATGTRFEIGGARVAVRSQLDGDQQDVAAEAGVMAGKLAVAGSDGDGFLAAILPEGLEVDFDLVLGWSRQRGFYLSGTAGTEVVIPIGREVLGFLHIDSVTLGLQAGGEPAGLRADVALTGSMELGPFTATVDRIGLRLGLETDEGPGLPAIFGPLRPAVGFRWPSGIGLKIDAAVVAGGGYLFLDPDKGEYAGVLQLDIKETVALTALGLLNTPMPGRDDGYSLLLILNGRFRIDLGYGFSLNGLGGLLGLHRTVDVDAIRAGVRSGAVDAIMFPEDPIRDAPQILRTLSATFPPAEGRHVFGPMAILGWGVPTMLEAQIGLFLELPNPVRMMMLGKLLIHVPDKNAAVVYLRCDVAGILDFDRRELSVDASLVDSRIATFPLTGDFAVRAGWGDNAHLVMSAGGLHPRFQAPVGFPRLRRLTIQLTTSNNPRLRAEAYVAITSNTVQFGGGLEIYAKAGKASISGQAGLDALIQFDPFGFEATVRAMVALKWGSKKLASLGLDMLLSGPAPWRARGSVKVKVLFITAKVSFNKRFGNAANVSLVDAVDVLSALETAAADPQNWAPRGVAALAVRRDDGEKRLSPLGHLEFIQRVVPLGVKVERIGNAKPVDGAATWGLHHVRLGGRDVAPGDRLLIREQFAPAQFFNLTDAQKLSRPAFEKLPAGVRLSPSEAMVPLEAPAVALEYETQILKQPTDRMHRWIKQRVQPAPMAASRARQAVAQGAVARGALRKRGSARYSEQAIAVKVKDEAFVVRDSATWATLGSYASASEAAEASKALSGNTVMAREVSL